MLCERKVSSVVKHYLIFLTLFVLLNSAVCSDCNYYYSPESDPVLLDAPSDIYRNRTSLRGCTKRCISLLTTTSFADEEEGGAIYRVYPGEFQHMVAIGWIRSENKIDYLCGGSLISPIFVLTAAHCEADQYNISPTTVRVGDTNLGSSEDDELAQQIAIARFITHPEYRYSRNYFDIAIIELQNEARFSRAVCSACLWRQEEVPLEKMDTIGFGATGFGKPLSPVLQRIELTALDENDCGGRIPVNLRLRPDGLRKDQFCAAGTAVDTCDGDSGGPIGLKRLDISGNVYHFVVGIVSFGTPCAVGSTGVYTKVSTYMDWIEQVTNSSFDYDECVKTHCEGRKSEEVPISNSDDDYRFGLSWGDADTSSTLRCGVTLIDDQYFLTSASCVTSSKGFPKFVTIEVRVIFDMVKSNVSVTDVYVSPQYRSGRPENNIALIKIAKYVNTKRFVPYCLWNTTIDGDLIASQLKVFGRNNNVYKLVVNGSQANKCDLQNPNLSDVVCFTNNINLIPGLCTVEYGGPVGMWNPPSSSVLTRYLYGLVSTSTRGCGSNLYMTDVLPHIDWMESIIFNIHTNSTMFAIYKESITFPSLTEPPTTIFSIHKESITFPSHTEPTTTIFSIHNESIILPSLMESTSNSSSNSSSNSFSNDSSYSSNSNVFSLQASLCVAGHVLVAIYNTGFV